MIGVIYSSVTVVLYEGSIILYSSLMKDFLTDAFINDLNSVGGILIVCIGLKISKILAVRVSNLLPGLIMPLVFHIVLSFV